MSRQIGAIATLDIGILENAFDDVVGRLPGGRTQVWRRGDSRPNEGAQ